MYDDFLDWAQDQELDFPCTATVFAARVAAFAAATTTLTNDEFVALLRQGGVNDDEK